MLIPATQRWMLFVDGENFAIRVQQEMPELGLKPGPYFQENAYVWFPSLDPRNSHSWIPALTLRDAYNSVRRHAIFLSEWGERARFYTTVKSPGQLEETQELIRKCGFDPIVYAKQGGKSKFVDLSIATDMLVGAYEDRFDVALLVTGDADFKPLIEQVRRLGKKVVVAFIDCGNGPKVLKLISDEFVDLRPNLQKFWSQVDAFTNPIRP